MYNYIFLQELKAFSKCVLLDLLRTSLHTVKTALQSLQVFNLYNQTSHLSSSLDAVPFITRTEIASVEIASRGLVATQDHVKRGWYDDMIK